MSIGTDLSSRDLTILDKSLITSSTSLFALLFSAPSGFLADSLGRKNVVVVADVLFVAGALLQAVSKSVWVMIIGRAIVGAAVGSASFVAPLYISELAPAAWRGRLVTVSALFITAGQVVAYIIGWLFSKSPNGWRWMVGLGAAPALVQLAIVMFMPDTPRWLAKAGRRNEARHVLGRIYGLDQEATADAILAGVEAEMRREEELIYGEELSGAPKSNLQMIWSSLAITSQRLWTIPRNRRALIISSTLQASQQLCGFVSLS